MQAMAGRTIFSLACLVFSLLLCGCTGQIVIKNKVSSFSTPSSSSSNNNDNDDGPMLVCYYTPVHYFLPSKVPSNACTHLIYAFGSISMGSSGPNISAPTQGEAATWVTLTSLRRQNPQLKVLLSLQMGFSAVVGPNAGRMQQFAVNAVVYLRKYQFDGVDMDWEFPSSSQRPYFAKFFKIMRTAIDKEARATGRHALLLSLALSNSNRNAQESYDIPTIASAVDFGTAMMYDFHLYNKADKTTGYNSPLYTPPGEYKYLSASAMVQYYLSRGMPAGKLLLGIPTYGRSWQLATSSDHGLHAPAVGKGGPGPDHHFPGVYTYSDACTALKEGARSVANTTLGATYLYKDTTWVAYDDTNTVTAKCQWAMKTGLGGVGVWAMHLDDTDGVCGAGSLPLIAAMKRTLLRQTEQRPQPLLSSWSDLHTPNAENAESIEPSRDVKMENQKLDMARKKICMHTSDSEPDVRLHGSKDALYFMENADADVKSGASPDGQSHEEDLNNIRKRKTRLQ